MNGTAVDRIAGVVDRVVAVKRVWARIVWAADAVSHRALPLQQRLCDYNERLITGEVP
jgi:hypothetical protein